MAVSSNLDALLHKNPDDVVITMAIRSPLCKAKKGGFKDMRRVSFSFFCDSLLTITFIQGRRALN
jgi:hypothetical protein